MECGRRTRSVSVALDQSDCMEWLLLSVLQHMWSLFLSGNTLRTIGAFHPRKKSRHWKHSGVQCKKFWHTVGDQVFLSNG